MTNIDTRPHPLYGIDDLDWSHWHTAYGDATDTQWNLKRLVNSKSRNTKENALWNLRASVFHQGGNYSVIPIALDYLIRILKAGCLTNKLELDLLCLITNLGRLDLFYGRWIATGIPTKDNLTQFLSNYESPQEITIFHQAYAKMEELRDYCLEKFKSHKNFAFRCQCIHLLMYLQNDQELIIAAIQDRYPTEKNLNVRLSIIWAVAFIAMHFPLEKKQQVHQWLLLQKPLAYRGVTAHMFTLVELYLGYTTPAVEKEFIQMIRDNIEYPLLLDQDRLAERLDWIALLLINKQYASSINHYQFYKTILDTIFHIPATESAKQYGDTRIESIIGILINLSFPEPVGCHQYWYDHTLQEQEHLRLKLNSQQIDILTFLCVNPVWINHATLVFLKKFKLPESYEEIALFLGWLPEFDYWKYKDQYLNKPQINQFPELKPIIEYRGLIPFIENFFSLSESQLDKFTSLLNWQNLCSNSAITFTQKLIHQHQDLWHWGILSNNKAIKWNADLLSLFANNVYWRAISEQQHLDWSELLIKQFTDHWDWSNLSLNQSLPWSIELINEFKTHWDWRDLSSNPALPWSPELIDRFADDWDWEELSENEALPWSEEFFTRYAKRWWHYKDALARNSKIPWTEDRLKKFDDFYWEEYLSKNNGLPWSESFIEKYQDKINWVDFSKVTRFDWTETFIEQHKDNLEFSRLAENPSLPWSVDLIHRYQDKWNWYVLSKNPELPWSAKLLEEFEDYWDWRTIPYNQHIPWSQESIAILKKHTRKISRIKSENFPWTLELVNDPAFAYLFDSDDDSLYSKVIAPVLNQNNVTELLNNRHNLLEDQKKLRRMHFYQYGPKIPENHPLRKILGL
jgi:hypothetical protein